MIELMTINSKVSAYIKSTAVRMSDNKTKVYAVKCDQHFIKLQKEKVKCIGRCYRAVGRVIVKYFLVILGLKVF